MHNFSTAFKIHEKDAISLAVFDWHRSEKPLKQFAMSVAPLKELILRVQSMENMEDDNVLTERLNLLRL